MKKRSLTFFEGYIIIMSKGPQITSLVVCPTVELKDLADHTLDFDKDGEVGAIYGFKLGENGHFARYEIDDNEDITQIRPSLKGILLLLEMLMLMTALKNMLNIFGNIRIISGM